MDLPLRLGVRKFLRPHRPRLGTIYRIAMVGILIGKPGRMAEAVEPDGMASNPVPRKRSESAGWTPVTTRL